MEFAIVILISIAFAAICHRMALSRNRNTTLWAVLGFCFGPIPVVLLALLGRG